MNETHDETSVIARRFLDARRRASPLTGYPGQLPDSLDGAYAIQDAAIAGWARPVIGWKVGRIHLPEAERFGADRLAGPIFRQTGAVEDDPEMPVFEGGFAAAESEFLLRIGHAPSAGKTRFTLDEAADHIDAVHVGIEIASSPLPSINALGPTSVISDFGNNNGILVGPAIARWRDSGFEDWEVVTLIDGREAGRGRARAFPDGAIGAARFLLELMARRGIALQPGQWISSGAVTGVHDARPGQRVEAHFDEGYSVSCKLAAARGE
ncbi:2-keto-4-pentenoate hydratase [Sphingosinicella terrae]|uniref:2-keto-4-pentenoate hydratase n=1 Tax=Sphingosinicella terrae TaxID=2172047 RepID=UPI000E0CC285|nr:2-keto-4-pentenoate hydratase [Sphingosinicella terrae]